MPPLTHCQTEFQDQWVWWLACRYRTSAVTGVEGTHMNTTIQAILSKTGQLTFILWEAERKQFETLSQLSMLLISCCCASVCWGKISKTKTKCFFCLFAFFTFFWQCYFVLTLPRPKLAFLDFESTFLLQLLTQTLFPAGHSARCAAAAECYLK